MCQSYGNCFDTKWLFVTTAISQGSVATRLRCCGQCDSQFVANFLINSTMEKFRKSVNICQSYGQKYRGPFLTHSVYQCTDVWLYHCVVSGSNRLVQQRKCITATGHVTESHVTGSDVGEVRGTSSMPAKKRLAQEYRAMWSHEPPCLTTVSFDNVTDVKKTFKNILKNVKNAKKRDKNKKNVCKRWIKTLMSTMFNPMRNLN